MTKEHFSSVSPKGQITLPREIRRRLGINPRDKVAIRLDGDEVKVTPIGSRVDVIAGSVPPLDPPVDWDTVEEMAHDEHAKRAAREGLEPR